MFNKPEESEVQQRQSEQAFAREQNTLQTDNGDDQTYLDQQDKRSDFLKWQQDMDEELDILVHVMLGYKVENNKWVPGGKGLCNRRFIDEVIIPQCKPFLSKNLINSNLDSKTILNNLKLTSNTLCDSMADGFEIYDIEPNNFDLIDRMIKNFIKPASFRALNGWTKKLDSTMIKRHELFNEQNKQQQGEAGIWNKIRGT